MKPTPLRLAAMLAAASLLCGCLPMPRKVAYDEAAFSPFRGSGSGTVSGQAYTVLRDNSMRVGSDATIGLMPDTAYTEEIAARTFTHGEKLDPPDPRFSKYVTFVTADNAGNFAFSHVLPGDYYVYCDLPFQYADDDSEVNDDQWIFAQITVKNGQTVQVTNWSQGK